MLRKSLWLTMVICLALALACSQEGAGPAEITLNPNQQAPATGAEAVAPPRNETAQVQTAAGSSSQAQAAAANRSDIPNTSRTAPVNQGGGVTTMPTGVEQPETTETMPDATSQTEAPDSTTGTAMAMAEKAETEEVQPQFSDEVLLQDIYAAIDMTRYALNETSPRWKERPISKRELPFEEYRDHPYLHLFPHLQRHIEDIQEEANATQKSHPKKFQYQLYFQRNDPTAQSNFIGRYGIEHFLAHPWYEPIGERDFDVRHTDEFNHSFRTTRTDYNARYFGTTSTRQILADTVGNLLNEAKEEGTEPYELPWENEPQRQVNPPSLTEYIKMAIAPYDDGYDRLGIPFPAYTQPQTRWDFLDPHLPVVHVEVYTSTLLPLTNPDNPPTLKDTYRTHIPIPKLSEYSVHFVIAFQNRWTSFADQDRWALRFTHNMQTEEQPPPNVGRALDFPELWAGGRRCHTSYCLYNETNGALDPALADRFPNYWDDSDYMQHSIIGPVILQVHSSPVLTPGTYSAAPSITYWPAPGPIVPSDKLLSAGDGESENPKEWPVLQRYPYPGRPNPGYPLPGHVYADSGSAPGSTVWTEYDLGPEFE